MNKLMEYLPKYYDNVEEIQYLTSAEVPEIAQLWGGIEQVRNNQFITTSDSNRIRLWERLLRIRPDFATQNLEYRKEVVLLRLSLTPPFTYRWLENLLNDRVGIDNYSVDLDHDNYTIDIHITHDDLNMIAEFRRFFRNVLPSNLSLALRRVSVKGVDPTPIIPAGITKTSNKHVATAVERNREVNHDVDKFVTAPVGLIKTSNKHGFIATERPKTSIDVEISPVGLIKTLNKHTSISIYKEV